MKFTDFNDKGEVIEKFNLRYIEENFIEKKSFTINEVIKNKILKNFKRPGLFNSEYAICEGIIFPILSEVSDANDLPIWSHMPLYSNEADLSGTPDYIFALSKEGRHNYKKPVVCLGEAKKEKFTEAWGQVAAEMVAAQKLNKNDNIIIYGLVTTGKVWDFAKLEKNIFTFNEFEYNMPGQFNEVLDILNWIFFEAKKNADKLEEIS